MVANPILPHSLSVLLSTIGVTIVGPKNIPERCMNGLFLVQRNAVQDALKFLQHNNPLYSDIIISEDCIATR
ncbi:hypothetical protein SERLA73DRAFT_61545 [Serpula lacrymans var. lacrymans S7.3]|uniref:DUF6570 domain-containing protein n=1 Tax=Serpula lacrymans var. lacrymans (strain S7.3) TaxID=936435 RepID=F8Q9H8_SERL3|nr:hypothetical protein SERLA73DRAFT_61545 [Serpula lacrymans var. lacrymans S7.3]